MVLSPSKPFICFTLNDKTSYIYWHHVCFRFVFVAMDTCIFINDNESNIKIAFVNQSSEALGKQYTSLTHDTWTSVTATLPPQASGVTANGKITLYAKVQDAHPKVRGHFDPKYIAPFLYLLQVFWGVDTQLLSQPGLECQAIFGAPASRGLGLITGVLHQPGSYGSANVFFINIKWSTINPHFPHLPEISPNLLEFLPPKTYNS